MIRLIGFLLTVMIFAGLASQAPTIWMALLLCPGIGYSAAWLWLPEVRWRCRLWIKKWWRKLRGRCPMCGEPRSKKPPNPLDIYSFSPTCRPCAKILLAGRLYGMGNRKAHEVCDRLYKGCEV